MSAVYLIHFEPAYKHAGHYLGFAEELEPRLHAHFHHKGARLTSVAAAAGCRLLLARVWPDGTRGLERQLKRWHGAARLCPICRGELPAAQAREVR
jgi:predicted GIY-YIG superfamily endonuclease